MEITQTTQSEKKIANKENVWHWIKRGVIMQLHFDFETSGIDRFGMSHSIQGYPFVTEYGDALGDISGNHVNSMQILPKRPERLIGDPAAPVVQRHEEGMAEYDKADRTPYPDAMAQIAHRFENAAFSYGLANEERLNVTFTDINKQAKNNKECEEEVIPIPLTLEDGSVVHHVRYHPERNKVSYLFEDSDTNSPYYENIDNLYYIDDKGKKWRWVEPSLKISGFNVKGYDIPVLRTNMLRSGMHPSNVPFAYSRATISNKQRVKNYLCDERHTALQVTLHGQHGEDGLKMGKLLNPMTGKFYRSESLGSYFKSNQSFPNQIRMVDGGIFLSNGELFDLQDAHGGVIDSIASLALNNKMNDISPQIVTLVEEQSDEKSCIRQLQGIDPTGRTAPLVSLPLRDFPADQTDSLYLFMNTDEQFGSFKQFVFFHMTGGLREYKFNGKNLHQLDVAEWEELIEKKSRDPDSPIRIEAFRRFGNSLPYNFVLQHSKEADRYRGKLECVDKDCNYIREHSEMVEKLYTAIGRQNAKRRFSPGVQNPIMEDEWLRQGFGEIYYQEESIQEERREAFFKQQGKPGPRKTAGIVETIKNHMQDHYNYLNMVDESLMRLFVTAHPIDFVDPESPDADAALENYLDLCKRTYKKLRDKDVPHIRRMGSYFMKGGTPRFKSIESARKFRDAMRAKAMEDYLSEIEESEEFALGLISSEFSKSENKLLFTNADRGERGGTPHIVDSIGREIPVHYIRKQKPSDVIDLIKRKEWKVRFYRLRSEPIIDTLVKICVDSGKRDLIPDALYKGLYEPSRQLSLWGAPNEDATTARHSNLHTADHQQKRLEINAKIRDQRLLERPNDPLLGEANKLVKYEEGQRILAKNAKYLQDLRKKFPYKKTLVSNMQFDPKSGLPYDYIHHIIKKENHVVIEVPAWHLRYPITQYDLRLPPHCLVLPKLGWRVRKKIEKGAKVILKEKETGRLFHPGSVSLHEAPKEGERDFSILNDTAKKAYETAKEAFPPEGKRIVLGIENLYPIANTRNINATHQTVRVPSVHFDGLTYPEMAALNSGIEDDKPEPLKGVIVPANYCSQKLEVGKQIQLRETTDNMFDNIHGEPAQDTGHIYETKLRHAIGVEANGNSKGIKIKDLFNQLNNGQIDQKIIHSCGFLNKDHMENHLRNWANKVWKNDFMEQHVLVLAFDKVRQDSWAYFNPPIAPEAAMSEKDKPIPPSAYQRY